MSFKTYKLSKNTLLNIKNKEDSINGILQNIENSIIEEYLKEQTINFGVNKIGDRIRKNKQLTEIFKNDSNNFFVKMTENNRSFMKLFIDAVINCENNRIDFIVLEKQFGTSSKIVDQTFITIDKIQEILIVFFDNFKFLKDIDIYFHELIKFDGYTIHEEKKFSRITKI